MSQLRNKSMWASLIVLAVGALSSFSGGRPEAQRETRTVGAFTEVSLGGSAHVVLKQGSPQSVVVEASSEALAEFETVVKDQKLRLGNRNHIGNYKDRGPVTVYITAPSLTALRVGGSGKLEVEGPLKAEAMSLDVSGSGSLQVPHLTASSLETALSGSGNVEVGGSCSSQEVRISGSGKVKAHDLKSETCKARISGSGDAHVYASRSADASISGSGSVYVAGGGQLSSSVHGSGRITKE
jgi:hypothetical protein